MAIKGQSITVCYTAWDVFAKAGKTGDAANHTLRLVRDGVEAVPTNTPSEVDAVNAKGKYELTLTAAEMDVDSITVCGVSSTVNVSIVPVNIVTDRGGLANLAATIAEIKTHTDLIMNP